MARLLFITILACAACSGEHAPRIAHHALLASGFHGIRLGDRSSRCWPSPAVEFTASTAEGRPVRGVVCCGSSEGAVYLDGVQHP